MSGYTVSPTTATLANQLFETLGCTEPQRRRFLQLEGAYERVRNLHGEAWAKAHFVEHWRTQEMARSDGVTIAIHDAVQAHLARATSGETITDTCPNLNMNMDTTSIPIPMSSSDPMSNSNSGLQPDTTWKSNSNSNPTCTTVLGRNPTSTSTSTPIPITTSNDSILTAIATANPTLSHNPRSGPGPGLQPGLQPRLQPGPRPGLQPGLGSASCPAHQAPVVSLPKPAGVVGLNSGTNPELSNGRTDGRTRGGMGVRLGERPDVVGKLQARMDVQVKAKGQRVMGMDVEMDGQREVDQGQQDEIPQMEDQIQRGQPQREDELERQKEDRIQSEKTNTRTSGEVGGREVEQEERGLRLQPQSQKDCEHIRVNGNQGREEEMEAEQHRLASSPSAITIAGTPLGSSSTSTVTVIGQTRTQMGMNSTGIGQEVSGTTRLDPMHREATQLDLASVSPRRLLLSNQRLPTRLSPTYLDPLLDRSPTSVPAVTMSAPAPVSAPVQIAAEADGPVVNRSCVRETKLKEQDKAVGPSRPLELEMATSPPGNALATVSSNAETSVEAVSSRMKRKRTSPARGSSLHSSTPNHHEPQNSRGGGKDNFEKPEKVTRTTLYFDEGESLIYRVGQRGISNEYLSGILRPDPDWKSWTSTSGKVKRHFYAEMVFQFKLSRDLARTQAGMRDGDGIGVEGQNESTDRSIDDDGRWDEDELMPAEECEKDLSDLVF